MRERIMSDLTEMMGDIIKASAGSLQLFQPNGNDLPVQVGLLEKHKLAMSPDDQVFLAVGEHACWINPLNLITRDEDLNGDGKASYYIENGNHLLAQIQLNLAN